MPVQFIEPSDPREPELTRQYPVSFATPQLACRAVGGTFVCTRMRGHTGEHVAHAFGRVVATWEDEGGSDR